MLLIKSDLFARFFGRTVAFCLLNCLNLRTVLTKMPKHFASPSYLHSFWFVQGKTCLLSWCTRISISSCSVWCSFKNHHVWLTEEWAGGSRHILFNHYNPSFKVKWLSTQRLAFLMQRGELLFPKPAWSHWSCAEPETWGVSSQRDLLHKGKH